MASATKSATCTELTKRSSNTPSLSNNKKQMASNGVGYRSNLMTSTCQMKQDNRRERAVTSICRIYHSMSSLAKEYTALFMTTQGMMGVKQIHHHEPTKRKGRKTYTSNNNDNSGLMSSSPYDNHENYDDDMCRISKHDDYATDEGTTSSGVHTMDSSPVHDLTTSSAVDAMNSDRSPVDIDLNRVSLVNDMLKTGKISRYKYGTEFLMNEENSDKTISPCKDPSLSATLSRKPSSLSRKLSWRSLSSKKSISPVKNTSTDSSSTKSTSPLKTEVLRSETRRINELFRKKTSATDDDFDDRCNGFEWRRNLSATLSLNKTKTVLFSDKQSEANLQHLEEISTTRETMATSNFFRSGQCPNCDTILHFAASNGELDIVRFYVEKTLEGYQDEDEEEDDESGNILSRQNKHLNTGLHCAVYYGHKDVVDVLLKYEAGIDLQNIDGDTALHIAVVAGKQYILRSLIRRGASINIQNNNGDTPLHLATHKGCVHSVELLIKSGARLDVTNKSGNTPLHSSINSKANKVVVQAILRAIDGKRQQLPASIAHTTDAMLDKMIDNLRKLQSLLWQQRSKTFEKSATLIQQRNNNNNNEWSFGFDFSSDMWNFGSECTEFGLGLSDFGSESFGSESFGDTEDVSERRELERSVNGLLLTKLKGYSPREIPFIVNMKNHSGDTALHRAVRYFPTLVPMLLNSSKIDTKYRNRSGETVLHIAVRSFKLKCQKMLSKHNKRLLHISDFKYNTPLHYASEQGFCRSVKYLLPLDYKKDMQNHQGNTSLHLAIIHQHYCIVWYLLENDADTQVANNNGDLPLHCAVRADHLDIFQLVLNKSNKVIDHKNNKGDTPLLLAIKLHGKKNSFSIIDDLVRSYADINAQDGDGNTALHLSSTYKLTTLSYRLISTQTVIPNLQNHLGDSVFHILVRSNDIDMIRYLINCTHGTGDFHIRNVEGETPLTLAISKQYLQIATLLLNCTWKVDLAIFSQLFE